MLDDACPDLIQTILNDATQVYEELGISGQPDTVHVNWYGCENKASGIGVHSDIKDVDPRGPVLTYTFYASPTHPSKYMPVQMYPFSESEYKNMPQIERLGYNLPTGPGSMYAMIGEDFQATCVHGMLETSHVVKRISASVRMSR